MNGTTLQPPWVAFKEWHVICDAIERGEQQVILRKGGIAEGRAGFAFQHRAFLLFPTFFHAQYEGVKMDVPADQRRDASSDRDTVEFNVFCRMERQAVITDWDDILRISAFHVWSESVLRERFDYGDQSALHLAVVRAFRLETPVVVPFSKRFGGCRSWVDIPGEEVLVGSAVIEESVFDGRISELANLLNISLLKV